MVRKLFCPPSFYLVKQERTSLLVKEEYKASLLCQGILDIESFIKKNQKTATYLSGRTAHPSIQIDDTTRVVVRRYYHGGMFRKLTRDLFLFGSRSFQEVAFTEEVRSCNIPTVEPMAAIHQVAFSPFYRAYLLTREVPNSKDLILFLQEMIDRPALSTKRRIIRSAGLLLQKFHQAGFFHGDLQLKNILMSGEKIHLIDFDRSYRKQDLSIGERMANLLRLNRSAEKWARIGLPITWRDRLRFFSVYAGEDQDIRKAMKKAIKAGPVRTLLHRVGWKR